LDHRRILVSPRDGNPQSRLREHKHIREEVELPGHVSTQDIFRESWIGEYGEDEGESNADEDNEDTQGSKFVDGEVDCARGFDSGDSKLGGFESVSVDDNVRRKRIQDLSNLY
jgi:hypothetical protein